MSRWRKFTKEEVEEVLKSSSTYSEMAQKLGYKCSSPSVAGYLTTIIKKIIKYHNLDDSYINQNDTNLYDFSIFKQGFITSPSRFFGALVCLRGHRCEICGNETWLGQKIKLEVHHKDGDHYNNTLNNLQLLCPNCHSMTENWRGGNNNKGKNPTPEAIFVEALKTTPTIRQALLKLHLTAYGANYIRARNLIIKYNIENQKEYYNLTGNPKPIIDYNEASISNSLHNDYKGSIMQVRKPKFPIPTKQELLQKFDDYNYNREAVANHYKVSGNLIRKWCNKLGIGCQNKKALKLLYRQEVLGLDLDKHIGPNRPKCTKIAQLDPNTGEVIKIYESKAAAGRAMGCSGRNLGTACDKPNRLAMGYKWSFKLANGD